MTPDLCRTIFSNLKPGRQQIARALQRRVAPLEYCPFNESPAAVKYALSLLGLMDPGTPLPIVQLDSPEKAAVAKAVAGIDDNLVAAPKLDFILVGCQRGLTMDEQDPSDIQIEKSSFSPRAARGI